MHFMIDTETLSTASDAAIIQIGIQAFDPEDIGLTYEGLLINIDGQTCIDEGMSVDWSTIKFWLHQDDNARASVVGREDTSLVSALMMLTAHINNKGGAASATIWSNGAAFDVPILENAFRVCGMKVPWSYNRVLDVRTMKFLAPEVERVQPVVAHDALSDAQAQALWVQKMYRKLKGNTPLGLLWDKLNHHDWTYMMSDDPRVNSEGAQKHRDLLAEARALGDEGCKLFDDWYKSIWESGERPDRPWDK